MMKMAEKIYTKRDYVWFMLSLTSIILIVLIVPCIGKDSNQARLGIAVMISSIMCLISVIFGLTPTKFKIVGKKYKYCINPIPIKKEEGEWKEAKEVD